MFENKCVLVLAPHTDDGELGCGGTISRMIREGANVWYVAFSQCEESLPDGLPKDTLAHELMAATDVLGIKPDQVLIWNYRVRHFSESRQQILDDLIFIESKICPNIVFMPSPHDIHQDHATISAEGIRAFKRLTIFAYELPWNNYSFNNQAFVSVNEQDVNKKVHALQKYESQNGRQYIAKKNIEALLRTHGMQIGTEYAEVFEIPRIVF